MKDGISIEQEKSPNTVYDLILEQIRKHITSITQDDIPTDYFTPHDFSHCQAVEKIVRILIDQISINLTDLEEFFLYASVWTHDIGMLDSVAKEFLGVEYSIMKKREIHDQISAHYVNNNENFRKIFEDNHLDEGTIQNILHTISIIIHYHRRKSNIERCPITRHIDNETIKLRLISCLLRLGDTLHIDSGRFNRKLYKVVQIGPFDRSARLHWLKSFLVSNVYLNTGLQEIIVTIDVPEIEKSEEQYLLLENIQRLLTIIKDDIYEDLLAVTPTIKSHCNSFFSSVEIEINYCQGFSKTMQQDLINTLNDLAILLSPNMSKVIEKSLDSISSISTMDFPDFGIFSSNISEFIKQMKLVVNERPGDIAITEIIKKFNYIFQEFPSNPKEQTQKAIKVFQDKFRSFADDIRKDRAKSLKKIREQAPKILKNRNNIFLFGYSEIVLSILANNSYKNLRDNLNIFIFECSGKRKLSLSNDIEYNDGINYAISVSKIGYKNITLLPDTSFGSLLRNSNKIKPENSILLFGVNSVEKTEDKPSTNHSSGHLMMALVAKHFKIPVYILADMIKVGKIDWSNLDQQRKGNNWLSGNKKVLSDLSKRNIKLYNYRADRLEKTDYDELILY